MRSLRSALFLAAAAIIAACAQMEAPPGGPADETPAEFVGSMPADGSLNTGPLDTLQLFFSEGVDRSSVLKSLRSEPPRLLRHAKWSGDTLVTLEFWDPFPPDSSICLYLQPGWMDRHGVIQQDWQVLDFSTGPRLLRGWVGGKVQFKRRPSENLHIILEDPEGGWQRSLRPDRQGSFTFRHLPVESKLIRLWAFEDVDGDSLYDPVKDFADTLLDSLILNKEIPHILSVLLNVIDPDEPGKIKSSFTSTDSLPGLFVIRLLADSLRIEGDSIPPGHFPSEWSDSLRDLFVGLWDGPELLRKREGEFTVSAVPPGPWALFIHRETGEDSIWDPLSEASYLEPGPIWVLPGEEVSLREFKFPKKGDSAVVPSLPTESTP